MLQYMTIIGKLITIIFILLLLYIVYKYIYRDVNTLSGIVSAQEQQKIDATKIYSSNSVNFTYSVWIYVDNWNYRYGESKVIFARENSSILPGREEPIPSLVLNPMQNNAVVSLAVYPNLESNTEKDGEFVIDKAVLSNIPLQKWVNILITTYGRTMDLYMDGKLVKTTLLRGVPKIDSTAPIVITPGGGFSGWTAQLQFWNESCNPERAWNIYKSGYGGSWLANLFGKYNIKISVMEGENTNATFVI